jgi:hypothetical protein
MSNTQNKPTNRRRKKQADVEHELQVAQISWTEWQGLAWPELRSIYAVPNQGLRSIPGYARMVDEGLKTGQWDLCLPVACRGFGALYIENKKPFDPLKPPSKQAKLTKEQIKRGHILTDVGNLCYVIRHFDHFVNLLTWYLGHNDPVSPIIFEQGDLWEYVDPTLEAELPY